jgi:hypothetical protein
MVDMGAIGSMAPHSDNNSNTVNTALVVGCIFNIITEQEALHTLQNQEICGAKDFIKASVNHISYLSMNCLHRHRKDKTATSGTGGTEESPRRKSPLQ